MNPPSLRTDWFGQLEDLQDLVFIERPIRRSLKTAEEIEQLTVDEDLNDIERAVYLLSLGQEVQRSSVITNLPLLVRLNPAETFRRVVPKVREVLHGCGLDLQLAAAASFFSILQDDIILIHTHTYSILKIILLHLHHRDSVVANAWLETLLSAIDSLPKETIKQEVLNPLVSQSQLSQPLHARLASCRILGKVACRLDCHTVKTDLLPLVWTLCQDTESEVRACMCHQLEGFAKVMGVDGTRTELLPELLELTADGDTGVRLASFNTITNLVDMMEIDDRIQLLVPLLMSLCEASLPLDEANEAAAASLSFQFGKLCSGLRDCLSAEQKGRLLHTFKLLCVAGLQAEGRHTEESTLIRCNCCYNLPAMVLFADPAHFPSELYPSFSSLCCDPEDSVRRSAAASFHQVVKLLGSNDQRVDRELVALLQDDSLEVLDSLINHLDETLDVVLWTDEPLSLDQKASFLSSELLSSLLVAEQTVGRSLRWRLHQKLLQRYSCLARLLPGELLHQNFSSRIFTILTTNKVLPVQKEAARTFCTFLRFNRKQEQRQEMIDQLIEDLARGRSYWNRLRFLDVCESAAEMFSRKYFNRHFLLPALDLVHDPVANVRYKLCQLLPRLRSCLRLPADKQLLQQLDFCVQKLLCREKDKDVVATIRKTVLELDKLDITEPFHKRQERDLLDQKKELEESVLLEMEQLERQQNKTKVNSDKKRRDNRTSLAATKSLSVSSSGPPLSSSGKDTRKSKLSRSRSLSSHPSSSDRPVKVKELGGASGGRRSSGSRTKDDSLRTAHFAIATISPTLSTPSMPVLIRSNTSGLLDRSGTLEHKSSSAEQRNGTKDYRTCAAEPKASTLNNRVSTKDHRISPVDSKTSDQENPSRKLSTTRKSFSVPSGRD